MRLLIVEDEVDLVHALAKGLRKDGYAVDVALDGEEALYYAEVNTYDLMLLDLNLPGMDGLDVLARVLEERPQSKVLILSARTEVEERVQGLDLGACDYVTKPFDFTELRARIRALTRRRFELQQPVLRCGSLTVDPAKQTVTYGGQPLTVTRKEFALLQYFLMRPGVVVSQEELLESLWDESVNPFTNVVRVYINALRRKLGQRVAQPVTFETVHGVGYRLNVKGHVNGTPTVTDRDVRR